MAIGDAFDQFEMLVREYMDPSVENLEVRATDVLWDLIQNMRNVTKMGRTSGGGPGYEAKWNVMVQRGGRMSGASFGETELYKMNTNLVMGTAASSQHLDPVDTPMRSYLPLKSLLRKARGSIVMNRDQMEADLLSEPIEKVAAGYVEDATVQVRHLITALGWGAGDGCMGQLDESSGATVAEGSTVWVSIKGGSPYRFARGQRYVACATTTNKFDTPRVGNGASARTPSYMRCVGVNPRTLEVGFESEPGQGSISLTNGDYLVYQGMWDFTTAATSSTDNSPSLAPNGVESLLKTSGNFPDTTTDVTNWPELQAFIYGDDASPELPEPEIFDEMLDYMAGAESETIGVPPILIAERSIWTLYNQLERRAMGVQLINQTFEAGGGTSGPLYNYADKPFVRLRSNMCKTGTVYGINPDSFIRFFPNDLTIRWAMSQGGMAGMSNIFRPVCNGRILTDMSAAEFDIWWQLAQTRPNLNCIRRGVYSRRTYTA